jgi:hypothetical protein
MPEPELSLTEQVWQDRKVEVIILAGHFSTPPYFFT